ncbi:MAG: hypothetical protein VX346_08795 [Planctomycetota bacterium]|nr:hypothetical protein [Planctomycetota bacterium]
MMASSPARDDFDDFLQLEKTSFADVRLALFYGCSGSGKSSILDFLARRHADFQERPQFHLRWESFPEQVPEIQAHLVFLDEVRRRRELRLVRQLLQQGNTVIAATHVAPAWFWPLRRYGKLRAYTTDRDTEKITRYLQRLRVTYTDAAVGAFCHRYGATFTDVDCILEAWPSDSFDQSYYQFHRHGDISTVATCDVSGRP